MKETLGKILRIFTTVLMVLSQSAETVRLFRRYKGEQMAELQAEKDKIAEERRQSAEMLAELQALRAQLGQNAPEDGAAPVPDSAPAAQSETPAERLPPRIPRHLMPPTAVAKSLSSPLTKTIPAPTTPTPRPVPPPEPKVLPESPSPTTLAIPAPILNPLLPNPTPQPDTNTSAPGFRPPATRKHTPQKARFAQPRRCAALTDIQYACGDAPRLCTRRALFRCEAVLPK